MIRIYDSGYRGECPSEDVEQINCMGWLEKNFPERWPLIYHVPNETTVDKKKRGWAMHLDKRKKKGVKPGVSDIFDINDSPIFICELKKRDGGRLSAEQRIFLNAADAKGSWVCVANGFQQFMLAYSDYLDIVNSTSAR
jgi:hypothetical protein